MSSVTYVYYSELNSSSFILVRWGEWVKWVEGWVAGLMENITNSAKAEAGVRAALGNKSLCLQISVVKRQTKASLFMRL